MAQADGTIDAVSPMRKFLIFNIKQSLSIGGVEQTMWFPPDYGESQILGMDPFIFRSRLFEHPDHVYHKGEDVVKIRVSSGDHLFVDRLTYNFRKPVRGDIIVFETAGIPKAVRESVDLPNGIPGDEFYIKRLVVLPNERVSIGDDRHLVINGWRLDASTPHFANVYGFNPDDPPQESHFSGHVNGTVAREFHLYPNLAPLFPNAQTVYTNGRRHLHGDGRQHLRQLRLAHMGAARGVKRHRQSVLRLLADHRTVWNRERIKISNSNERREL